MALYAATPENLSDFAISLGNRLAQLFGGGSAQPSEVSGNFVYIDSYIRYESANDGIPHLYLIVDSAVSMSGISLRYSRKGHVRCRRVKNSPYHNNESGAKAHSTGWHQVWRLPLHSVKTPLFTPVLMSDTPSFSVSGKAYYEITVENYDTFYDFINDSDFSTGYIDQDSEPVPIGTILSKLGGICLIRNNVQVSNYAHFRASFVDSRGVYTIGR